MPMIILLLPNMCAKLPKQRGSRFSPAEIDHDEKICPSIFGRAGDSAKEFESGCDLVQLFIPKVHPCFEVALQIHQEESPLVCVTIVKFLFISAFMRRGMIQINGS